MVAASGTTPTGRPAVRREGAMAETVRVTGGTGIVAGWCIVDLLRRGYAVPENRALAPCGGG